ncbi:MAG: hypothetical protein HYR90_01210 [Candidatus Andersenbacteria bacterium]|nr:hypothetical protein [Candidatus Andersenbacteria bacterium]MBI3250488.1 hypothetical protein [Candidatus Andersenbacteria bacterium]
MIHATNPQEDTNLIGNSTEVFVTYYNRNIPDAFPHATRKTLNVFKAQYPSLFKENGEWIIDKHRKKYMDWLASYHDSQVTP